VLRARHLRNRIWLTRMAYASCLLRERLPTQRSVVGRARVRSVTSTTLSQP
jgi:hypothetical protein